MCSPALSMSFSLDLAVSLLHPDLGKRLLTGHRLHHDPVDQSVIGGVSSLKFTPCSTNQPKNDRPEPLSRAVRCAKASISRAARTAAMETPMAMIDCSSMHDSQTRDACYVKRCSTDLIQSVTDTHRPVTALKAPILSHRAVTAFMS